jgi:hypothetical protein
MYGASRKRLKDIIMSNHPGPPTRNCLISLFKRRVGEKTKQ